MPEIPAPAQEPPARPAPLRLAVALASGVLLFAALVILGRELIAAQVPQHRAALEEFIRHETGLEITFSRLSVRFGWYGPEAVFESAVLGEPGAPPLLRAAQVVVGVDAWRSVRSGRLEAGRIRLIAPEIDLASHASGGGVAGRGAVSTDTLSDAPRWLARWRGGRIEIEDGSLHWPGANGAAALTLHVQHAQVRRLGADWSTDVQLLLPDSLGTTALFAARFKGDLARTETLEGTFTFHGERLAFEGWRRLVPQDALAAYVPRRGAGTLELQGAFSNGGLARLTGSVTARSLEWAPRAASQVAFALPGLQARWQLVRAGDGWRLNAQDLDVGVPAPTGAAQVTFAAGEAHATLQEVPVATLAALTHWWAPQVPLAQLVLAGRTRTLEIDWDARRPAGERFVATAQLEELTLASAAGDVVLSGLSAQVHSRDAQFSGELTAHDAHLVAHREQPLMLAGLSVQGHVAASLAGAGWSLDSDDFEVRAGAAHLGASLRLAAASALAPPHLAARVQIQDTDAADVATLLGPGALQSLGLPATQLTAGHIASADFALEAELTSGGQLSGAASHGTLELRDAALAASDAWPELQQLAAHIDWQGTKVRANITAARSGSLALSGAQVQWDASGRQGLRASARMAGEAGQLLGWLREHPRLADSAPLMHCLDLEGDTQLNVELVLPGSAAPRTPPRVGVTAALQGARLRPVAGLPAIEALHGTLVFGAAHLQRATLVGRWLGGPVTLALAEHREGTGAVLALSAHGLIEARQAFQAANGQEAGAPLSGSADWSGQLLIVPQPDPAQFQWRLHLDSSLAGVTSTLPEPLAKSAAAVLPLHLEMHGEQAQAQLRLSLGERLQGVARLERSGDRWRLERGALRVGANAPELPGAAVLALEGRVTRLDLGAYLELWRAVAAAQTLPPLQAQLSSADLVAGRSRGEASVVASGMAGGTQLSVESEHLRGALYWPARTDAAHPSTVQLARLDASGADAAFAAALPGLLGPAVELSVEDLRWQGRALGKLHATLSGAGAGVHVRELRLTGAHQELRGAIECAAGARCTAQLSLRSEQLAQLLADYGLRADMVAQHAQLDGELEWPQGSPEPLATLTGHLHMQLEQGETRSGAPGAEPFALFLVPALLEGLGAQAPRLRFARLGADFTLRDGLAGTTNLHLDGADAEILVRARVNLLARDYDGEAFVLRGEERLPAALRRLGPTPKVAALWLSLREWFTGSTPEDTGTALRLRGAWNDPIVTPAQ